MSFPRINLGYPASFSVTDFPQQASTSTAHMQNPSKMPSTECQIPQLKVTLDDVSAGLNPERDRYLF